MVSYPSSASHPDATITRLGEPQSDVSPEVLLHYFLSVLDSLDQHAARKMRDELVSRFGGRYCNHELCSKMVELLNGHLETQQMSVGSRRAD